MSTPVTVTDGPRVVSIANNIPGLSVVSFISKRSHHILYYLGIYDSTAQRWVPLLAHRVENYAEIAEHLTAGRCYLIHAVDRCKHGPSSHLHIHTDIPTLLTWLRDICTEVTM